MNITKPCQGGGGSDRGAFLDQKEYLGDDRLTLSQIYLICKGPTTSEFEANKTNVTRRNSRVRQVKKRRKHVEEGGDESCPGGAFGRRYDRGKRVPWLNEK